MMPTPENPKLHRFHALITGVEDSQTTTPRELMMELLEIAVAADEVVRAADANCLDKVDDVDAGLLGALADLKAHLARG